MEDRIDFQKIIEESDNFGGVLAVLIIMSLFDKANMEEIKEKACEE